MKKLLFLLLPALVLISCGDDKKKADAAKAATPAKEPSVSVTEIQPVVFNANIEVQAQVTGDENVNVSPQAPGKVTNILVHVGQKVSKGQVLATLDAATIDQQIASMQPQLTLTKSLYEKQKNLWEQNIGSEVQLLAAKTNYENVQQQIAGLKSQRDLYRLVSPISGTVDNVGIKLGDIANPGAMGIRVVSYDKLKVEAMLGENYLGKVNAGDKVKVIFPDLGDTIATTISYVSQSVDVASRGFQVEVKMDSRTRLHPNMSCLLKISNYENKEALVVPVAVIQKTEDGEHVFLLEGGKAKDVAVTTGRISNGIAEVRSGLNAGDKLITAGYEELENGQKVKVQ